MLLEISAYIPFLIVSMISAFYAYKLDVKYSYVGKINKKLGLKHFGAIFFYIGLMSLSMFFVPYILVIKLGVVKYIATLVMSIICGMCCYSAMDYKSITA